MVKKSAARHPHSFGHTFFGVLSYIAMLGIWLLVITCIATISSLSGTLTTVSETLNTTLQTDSAVFSQSASSSETIAVGIRFVLVILLLVIVWIFSYFAAKFGSHILRHFIALFGQKVSHGTIATMKYLIAGSGLMGIVILLQFFPAEFVSMKLSIAFLAFVFGIMAITAIWVQKVLLERHKIPVTQAL